MKRGIFLHDISHILLPCLIAVIIIYISPNVDIIKLMPAIFIGAFFPDIDHLVFKKYYRSYVRLFKYCIGDRTNHRRTFLFFHTWLTMLLIGISIPFGFIYNFYLGIFLLLFFSHLLLDLLTDIFMIKKCGHWRI